MTLRRAVAALATLATVLPAQVPDFYDMDTVRDVYLQFSQSNWWTQLTNNYVSETNIAADMTVDGITYPGVGVRFRGNTSYTMLPAGSQKKSFNVELGFTIASQDIYGYDSLNFNNGFHDPLFLREAATYWVMRRHGVAPKANWIRLWLNNTYWGVYINVQQPNKDMMKEWFRSNDGNRYRGFPTTGGFQNGRCCYTVLPTVADYFLAYQVKQGDAVDLRNMCVVLNAMTTSTPQSTLLDVFNVDSFYRYAAVMNVCTQTDSYIGTGKDHFLYIDDVHGDGTTFPFDLNEAMVGSTTLTPTSGTTTSYKPAFTRTLQFADWAQRYRWHFKAIVDHTFNPTVLTPKLQQWHQLIYNDVVADTKKIYSTTAFQQNLTTSVSISAGGPSPTTITGLIPWVQSRYNHLNAHAYVTVARATLGNLAHSPAQPNPTQPITITVAASSLATGVNLCWRQVGRFLKATMYDDGAHGDGAANDGTWGAMLPAQAPGALVDYYVEAVTAAGALSYEPHTAELERDCPHIQIDWPVLPSAIVINEFVAQNQNGAVDENNQHEDWLELYNTSNQPVDVSGWWLSDSLVVLKWQLPASTTIAAHSVLRIWCDEDGTQGPLHADFKLSATGEEIGLFDAAGTALHDSYVFGQQYADISTGRLFDGGSLWVTFPEPTHLATNVPATCGQRGFGALDAAQHGVQLVLSGTLRIGTVASYQVQNGPAGGLAVGAMSLLPGYTDLAAFGVAETYLLQPGATVVGAILALDGTGAGSWTLALPNDPFVVGLPIYAQTVTTGAAGFDSSSAIELRICP